MRTLNLPLACLALICVILALMHGRESYAQAGVRNLDCSASTTSGPSFGSIDILSPVVTARGTLKYSCKNTGPGAGHRGWVIVCFGIGDGSGGPGSYNPRKLKHASSTDALNYQIYQGGDLALPWGDLAGNVGSPVAVGPRYLESGQSMTDEISMTAQLATGQVNARPGMYTSQFTGAQTQIGWKESSEGASVTPASCTGLTSVGSGGFAFGVSASVTKQCYVSTSTSELNFGSVSSLGAAPVMGQSTVEVKCTNGTAYQVGLDNGSYSQGGNRYMKKTTGADLIRYELYTNAGRSVRWGNIKDEDTYRTNTIGSGHPSVLSVYGTAFPGPTASAGDYADTVTVTLYY